MPYYTTGLLATILKLNSVFTIADRYVIAVAIFYWCNYAFYLLNFSTNLQKWTCEPVSVVKCVINCGY